MLWRTSDYDDDDEDDDDDNGDDRYDFILTWIIKHFDHLHWSSKIIVIIFKLLNHSLLPKGLKGREIN